MEEAPAYAVSIEAETDAEADEEVSAAGTHVEPEMEEVVPAKYIRAAAVNI